MTCGIANNQIRNVEYMLGKSHMTSDDQLELNRLCVVLETLEKHTKEEIESEALKKAALALSVAYIHGHKSEIESLYSNLDTPLSISEIEDLIKPGLDPEK